VVIIVNLLSANSANQQLIANISGLGLACYYVVAVLIDSFNMAFRDELSGIPSRRALMQFVQTLGRKYVVVMADIDHFKKFNDTYGHDVGDQVLKLVASQLNKVSGGGRAFRYGGEEFTLVFPRKTINEVIPHVEVLRRNIADYAIALRGQDRPKHPPKKGQSRKVAKPKTVSVTCSFGVAERSAEINDFTKILKQADVALYAAKKVGRNCVQQA
jgi:diguanylate cyclase (GGDEF)-like protein